MLSNLKKLRQEYGYSQQRLAEALGVSQPSINKYENHDIEPDIDILIRMADVFNTSIDYIVGRTDFRARPEKRDECALNADEKAIIMKFRFLSPDEQKCLDRTMEAFLKYHKRARPRGENRC